MQHFQPELAHHGIIDLTHMVSVASMLRCRLTRVTIMIRDENVIMKVGFIVVGSDKKVTARSQTLHQFPRRSMSFLHIAAVVRVQLVRRERLNDVNCFIATTPVTMHRFRNLVRPRNRVGSTRPHHRQRGGTLMPGTQPSNSARRHIDSRSHSGLTALHFTR